MDFFPLFHRLTGRRVLLVGGGAIAERKATLLAKAGAELHVVAPDIRAAVSALVQTTGGAVQLRPWQDSDLVGAVLVVSATGVPAVDEAVAAACTALNLPVNVVDRPELCSVIFPSIIDRSPLLMAMSSGGTAPVLLRRLRRQLEGLLPAGLGRLASWAGARRKQVQQRVADGDTRRRLWEQVLDGPAAEAVLGNRSAEADVLFDAALESAAAGTESVTGEVWLVGAGPGDPDLLTLKALRLMQQADVVFHDNLVPEAIVDMVRRDAERFYVGKKRDAHSVPQDQLNDLLVAHARKGQRVLRLKGGDPFIFGRGGEEMAAVVAAGIPCTVVPGITAASGCAAYAGIPLTHRDHAQSVRFVTGHRRGDTVNLDWPELARPGQTLVFYMGLAGLAEICARLVAAGAPASTAAALVERGTMPDQRVLKGTLDSLPEIVRQAGCSRPTLLIVGDVVALPIKGPDQWSDRWLFDAEPPVS